MSEKIKKSDYATNPKVNNGLKTQVEEVNGDQLKFYDFEEWVPLSECKFFAENEGGFV